MLASLSDFHALRVSSLADYSPVCDPQVFLQVLATHLSSPRVLIHFQPSLGVLQAKPLLDFPAVLHIVLLIPTTLLVYMF
jgi:hypothetical protein